MTKTELLADLRSRPYFGDIIGIPALESTNEVGDKVYRIGVMGIFDKVVKHRHILYAVRNEDTPAERAFYFEQDPDEVFEVTP